MSNLHRVLSSPQWPYKIRSSRNIAKTPVPEGLHILAKLAPYWLI
jgi:hypothetical protein